MANPILAGDILRLTTDTTVLPTDYVITVNAATNGPAQKTTVANLTAGSVLARGTFVLNGATPVTVAAAGYAAITNTIAITLNTVGGTVGAVPAVKTVTAGTGFTVAGTASDTSTYNYKITV